MMKIFKELKFQWRFFLSRRRALRRLNRALKDGIVRIDLKGATSGAILNTVANEIRMRNCERMFLAGNTLIGNQRLK